MHIESAQRRVKAGVVFIVLPALAAIACLLYFTITHRLPSIALFGGLLPLTGALVVSIPAYRCRPIELESLGLALFATGLTISIGVIISGQSSTVSIITALTIFGFYIVLTIYCNSAAVCVIKSQPIREFDIGPSRRFGPSILAMVIMLTLPASLAILIGCALLLIAWPPAWLAAPIIVIGLSTLYLIRTLWATMTIDSTAIHIDRMKAEPVHILWTDIDQISIVPGGKGLEELLVYHRPSSEFRVSICGFKREEELIKTLYAHASCRDIPIIRRGVPYHDKTLQVMNTGKAESVAPGRYDR